MKKILAVMLVLVFALSSVAFAENKGELHMGTNAHFPPYEYHEIVDGADTILGIDAEIAAAVCDYLGYTLVIDDMEFGAIISAVQTGKVDFGMAGMTVTDERKQSVNFSDTYATGIQVVIVKEGSPITTVDDLTADHNYAIGVQEATTGDLYCTWDVEDEGLGTVERYKTGADAVQALLTGKVDCVVIDNEPAKAFVAANEGLVILDTEYTIEDYAIAIALDNETLLNDINGALAALTADGTIPAIIAKYIPTED
ncbi:MAG: amino acid ABC transporter substrate-binding protein [Clostridia bacterium]|nr:amino acid ABC transporter substrate-binding protein [Clostridia bacterium]